LVLDVKVPVLGKQAGRGAFVYSNVVDEAAAKRVRLQIYALK
jgi:hypothetical protein